MKRLSLAVLGTLLVAACQDATQPVLPDVPLAEGRVEHPLERMIVVFQPGARDVAELSNRLAGAWGRAPSFVYTTALQGFAAELPAAAREALAQNPLVAYVEDDPVRTITAQNVPTGIRRMFAAGNANVDIDGTDDFRVDVDVAIIDTGIDFEHPDLNVVGGVNCTANRPSRAKCTGGGDDDHYHGTHVGGTVAALDNGDGVVGVAPGARLWAVKVLDRRGSGYGSWIIAGIDWVAANAATIEVANMSLGGTGYSQAEYDAIQGAVNAGVAFAVAAGNSNADANGYSPAAFDNALTVSALADFDGLAGGLGSSTCRTDQDDTLAGFSNWGSAVDIAAPGVCIYSTVPLEQGSYGTLSGTSMASPHVAGALALLASRNNPANAADVESLYSTLVNAGNLNWTDDSGDGIKERLLDVSSTTIFNPVLAEVGGSGGGPTDNPPTVSITGPTGGATVSGSVTVTANASDDGNVVRVEFFVDGASIGTDADGADGWSVVWNTAGVADGSHSLTARATDDATSPQTTTSSGVGVTVQNGTSGGDFNLAASGFKVKGIQNVDLTWSGATSAQVAVFRDGALIATVSNNGSWTENLRTKGGATYTYQVCEAGTSTCSNTAVVLF